VAERARHSAAAGLYERKGLTKHFKDCLPSHSSLWIGRIFRTMGTQVPVGYFILLALLPVNAANQLINETIERNQILTLKS